MITGNRFRQALWWIAGGVLLAGIFLVLLFAASPARAQNPVSDDQVNAVAKKLYCPICENTPLDVCPTQACKDWRELIRQQLGDGWTEEQILDYFVANYGQRVLAQPPANGFSGLVWILPVIGLLAGGIFLWRLLRAWQRKAPNTPPLPSVDNSTVVSGDIPPDIANRIEKEIQARF